MQGKCTDYWGAQLGKGSHRHGGGAVPHGGSQKELTTEPGCLQTWGHAAQAPGRKGLAADHSLPLGLKKDDLANAIITS